MQIELNINTKAGMIIIIYLLHRSYKQKIWDIGFAVTIRQRQ